MNTTYTNHLIDETSPYLLQHAHNPVNWYPWSKETLEMAQRENKPIIVSIGYSSCHWCHVMAHQTFENETIALVMNKHFVCIKVDREEHPDIDKIYMNAAQLITGNGGWPLNCFALPDGRPFYGGIYFTPDQWLHLLDQISSMYRHQFSEIVEAAESIERGIRQSEQVIKVDSGKLFEENDLTEILLNWKRGLDFVEGGSVGAPKFPMPNSYDFLMQYAHLKQDSSIDSQVRLTLTKMAFGGIYDQLGGGFARYSTDAIWKVPHFEKMLYDNAQLVSLYSHAYQKYQDYEYKRIVEETLEFVEREMTNKDGLFFSALDADSEGVEGKFYVWNEPEIDALLEQNAGIFKQFYQINDHSAWENDEYILMRHPDTRTVAKKNNLSEKKLSDLISDAKQKLMQARDKRIRPGLDDKSLLSWNSLMIEAYCDAYAAFTVDVYLEKAKNAMNFILQNMQKENGSFWHTYKNGEAKINAYLDDYASLISALIRLSEVGAGNEYLYKANEITHFVINKFHDQDSGMFFFTSEDNDILVSRKIEIYDNVIPSSNSIMAKNLYKLSVLFENETYLKMSEQMLHNVKHSFERQGLYASNWGIFMMNFVFPAKEIAIVGNEAKSKLTVLQRHYTPVTIFANDVSENTRISLLANRFVSGKTLIYVCEDTQCKQPTEKVEEALEVILTCFRS